MYSFFWHNNTLQIRRRYSSSVDIYHRSNFDAIIPSHLQDLKTKTIWKQKHDCKNQWVKRWRKKLKRWCVFSPSTPSSLPLFYHSWLIFSWEEINSRKNLGRRISSTVKLPKQSTCERECVIFKGHTLLLSIIIIIINFLYFFLQVSTGCIWGQYGNIMYKKESV